MVKLPAGQWAEELLTGSQYRLSRSGSWAIRRVGIVTVPEGAILRVIALEGATVRLAWQEEVVVLFTVDLERRGELMRMTAT
jgi:hypothetical protein